MERAGWRCSRCKGTGRLEVHHKVALAAGGDRFALSNLEVLCRRCHFEEHKVSDPERDAWKELIHGTA